MEYILVKREFCSFYLSWTFIHYLFWFIWGCQIKDGKMQIPAILLYEFKWHVKQERLIAISTTYMAREPSMDVQLNIGSKDFEIEMSALKKRRAMEVIRWLTILLWWTHAKQLGKISKEIRWPFNSCLTFAPNWKSKKAWHMWKWNWAEQKSKKLSLPSLLWASLVQQNNPFLDCIVTWWRMGSVQQSTTFNTVAEQRWSTKTLPQTSIKTSFLVSKWNHQGPIFFHDNAWLHVAWITLYELNKLDYRTLPPPVYSPDLSLTDYHFFKLLDHFLECKVF